MPAGAGAGRGEALAGAVLDALAVPGGPEDTRSRAQRCHDALEEAMRRLAASGLLPDRAGQPVRAWGHISLADLMVLDGDSALQQQWTARVRAEWAARRAADSEGGGDGGAWLDGDTVPAAIRTAVIPRGQHCRFPGCRQPARACHVHHIRRKAGGGATSITGCVLLCPCHHLTVIHRRGRALVLNPDGTTTAWNPDRSKVLYSHGPPAGAG